LTKREENQLLLFERKVLRRRRRYNHELDKEFNSPNALNITKTRSLRYDDQKTRKPTTKSSIQSQTQWKEKSRKTEIQVGGWGDCTHCAKDRQTWKELLQQALTRYWL
jgi:hypothetical protein